MKPPSNTILALRGTVFILLAAWMVGGPAYRQLLGGQSRVPRSWVMFTGFAVGEICDVRFTRHSDVGIEHIDRLAVLGYASPDSAPDRVRRIRRKKDAVSQGRQLCRELRAAGASAPDVRLSARCARRSGWHVVSDGTENLCAD